MDRDEWTTLEPDPSPAFSDLLGIAGARRTWNGSTLGRRTGPKRAPKPFQVFIESKSTMPKLPNTRIGIQAAILGSS